LDDGSRDGTADYVEAEFGGRVRCVRKPNGGPSRARNSGAAVATGDWIAFLDSDDWWFPEKLETQTNVLARDPRIVFGAAGHILVSETQEQPIPLTIGTTQELMQALLLRTALLLSSVVVRRDVFVAAGGFREDLFCGEDRELWCRLVLHGEPALHSGPLVYKADRPLSLSNDPLLTLRDGLRVSDSVCRMIGERLNESSFRQSLLRRKAHAEVYRQVSWLYRARGERAQARRFIAKSLAAWPFSAVRARQLVRLLLP
jgi:glycosyltransferase involved in cell wall biosynthesis